MQKTILVINTGSSSIKFQLFAVRDDQKLERLIKGQMEGIGSRPRLSCKSGEGRPLTGADYSVADVSDVPAALTIVMGFLREQLEGRLPTAVGHRVVHGGPKYSAPTAVTVQLISELDRLAPLAPQHQPNNLAAIRAIHEHQPQLLQVACFDTAFHRTHPEVADRYAVPEWLYEEGVRRYGFHGLSYEYVAGRLVEVAPHVAGGRVLVSHLGSGCSMCAIVSGRSVDSSMGFTALDGLPMGTRPGQIDPGIVLYLLKNKKLGHKRIEDFLYNECGMKGLSGFSNDVRDLVASDSPSAKLALDCLSYRIALFAGALATAMGGVDAFVFTAGIGENAPAVREAVVRRLEWLGIVLDPAQNNQNATVISSTSSRVLCYVIATDEELMIATHTLRILTASEKRA